MQYVILPQRALTVISGEDALSFLQGLVSNDVARLHEGKAVYAALLSPQGRFLHDFFLMPWHDAILLDCDKDRLPDLLQRLKMYRLRSRVAIGPLPESTVAMAWGDAELKIPHSDFGMFADPRLPDLGWRIIGDAALIEAWCKKQAWQTAETDAYEHMRLERGVPEGARDMIPDKSLLLEFGFEDLHGVDFAKGCYVGQEVTARSKHRGQVRKCIYQVRADDSSLPDSGTPVYAGDAAAGKLCSHAGNIGLALLRVEDVEKAQANGAAFRCGDARLTVTLPAWLAKVS